MKRFACGDVVPGCDSVWTCSTEDELFARITEHAHDAHGLSEIPDELVAAVRSNIVSVA